MRVRYSKDKPQVESERKRAPRGSQRSSGPKTSTRNQRANNAGRRIANAKRDERDERLKAMSRRRALIIVAIVLAVAGVVWGAVALWNAPLFTVEDVQVQGVSHLSTDTVLALAKVPTDATLLRLPASEIVKRVESSPWVASASLSRSFPHTLVLHVTERVPAVIVDAGAKGEWLVSGDGYWIAPRSKEPTGTLVFVKAVPNLNPQPGVRANSAELTNALQVIAGLSPALKAQTKYVSAETIEKTMLVLKNDVQIFIGTSDEIGKKDLIARSILSKQKDVVYINVRVTDRFTWRGLKSGN